MVSSIDGCVRIFDIRRGEVITDNFASPVISIALSHDKKSYIASCSNDKINFVEILGGQVLKEYSGHKLSNYTLKSYYNHEDSAILTGSEDGSIYVYDTLTA